MWVNYRAYHWYHVILVHLVSYTLIARIVARPNLLHFFLSPLFSHLCPVQYLIPTPKTDIKSRHKSCHKMGNKCEAFPEIRQRVLYIIKNKGLPPFPRAKRREEIYVASSAAAAAAICLIKYTKCGSGRGRRDAKKGSQRWLKIIKQEKEDEGNSKRRQTWTGFLSLSHSLSPSPSLSVCLSLCLRIWLQDIYKKKPRITSPAKGSTKVAAKISKIR